jgi:hypothetical protein
MSLDDSTAQRHAAAIPGIKLSHLVREPKNSALWFYQYAAELAGWYLFKKKSYLDEGSRLKSWPGN